MKKQILTLAAAALMMSAMVSCQQKGAEINTNAKLSNDLDSVSYILGINLGNQFYQNLPELSIQPFLAGFKKALDNDTASFGFTPQQADNLVRAYMMKQSEKKLKENLDKAESFLAENKTKEGVVTTESGLQYKVIKPGDGKQFPTNEDEVECLYRGTLINGQEFDGTDLRGNEPARFPVSGVIKGWTEMLKLMSLGEKVQVWIHPDLGYGQMDNGVIAPNSLLIFEMELVQIIKPEPVKDEKKKK